MPEMFYELAHALLHNAWNDSLNMLLEVSFSCHCEEQSDEAITVAHIAAHELRDCRAPLRSARNDSLGMVLWV